MEYRSELRCVVLAALGAVCAFGVGACTDTSPSDSEVSANQHLGTIGLALQLAPDVVLDTLDYQITSASGFSLTGTLPVPGASNTFSASIGGLPVGPGYQLRLSARAAGDAGLACAGSATFDVLASATTQVTVALSCDSPDSTGSVAINGSFNVCPSITATTVTPLLQNIGGAIVLSAAARDVDHGPAPLSYSWTSANGPLVNATTTSPTFTCVTAGPITVHFEISDGTCSKEGTLTATCSGAASQPDAGIDAGSSLTRVVINEIESNGGTPDDWVELYNAGNAPVDISGWGLRDNDATHAIFPIAAGTVIAPGAYVVLDTVTPSTPAGFPFGLGSADSTNLYAPDGKTIVDSYSWTAHAVSTYGRCPNGTGAFTQTLSSKGVANVCGAQNDGGSDAGSDAGTTAGSDAGVGSDASGDLPWPGPSTVSEVDAMGAFASNLSGLSYQAGTTVASSVLWGVQNGPSMLYRLHDNGTLFVSATDNNWGAGKQIFYPNGLGGPDSEGVVYVAGDSAGTGSLYVSTERDNSNNTVSRLSVLQFDANAAGATLTALREWNLTADLPAVGPNLGLEGVTFVSDAELSAQSFRESSGQPYNQARFAQHGGGVFLVGVEGTGFIHVYALNHADSTFAKLASFSSGMPAVMDLAYDPDTNYLWAYGDDTQGNRAVLFEIESNPASPSYGQFVQRKVLAKPAGLPPYNNEGISFAPESECAAGLRSFFWADDGADGGHSLRRGAIPCGKTY